MKFVKRSKVYISLIIGLIALFIVYLVLQSSISGILKFLFSVVILYIVSLYYKKSFGFESFYGLLLLRSKKGLEIIESFSNKYKNYVNALSDISYSMAFGFLSVFFIDWIDIKKRVISLLCAYLIFFIIYLVEPAAISYIFNFSDLPKPGNVEGPSFNIVLLISLFGGFFLLMLLFIINASYTTLLNLVAKIMGKNVVLHQNVTLILPGINIPLFEGIIALGVILIVHEFAHGISAVAHKIKLQNTGLVLFGSLVVGAFVEVDEKKLFRSSKKEQLRVLSSGIGSNFIFSVMFGFLFILFLALTQQYTLQGCYVKAENIIILFDSTTPCIKAGPMSAIRVYTDPILNSIYNILGLLTVLNFTVATINILPLPFFDGDHILKATLGNGNLYNIIRAITIICFIILILPAFV